MSASDLYHEQNDCANWLSMSPTTRHTIDSTAKMRIAISASLCWMAPNSAIAEPNALRSLAYFKQMASTFFAPPTAPGPSFSRPMFRMLNAMMCPRPISPSTFSTGTLNVVEIHGRGRAAFDAHLVFFGAAGHAGKAALHQECCELLAAHFREYGKEICRASVGDPHLLSVQDVVFAVWAEIRPGTHGESIGAGQRFGQRVSRQQSRPSPARARYLRFCSSVAKEKNGQRTDAGMGGVPRPVRTVPAQMLARDHYGRQVHFHTAEFLGNRYCGESQFGRLCASTLQRDARLLLADRLEMRLDLIRPEFVDRPGDCEVFFAQIFCGENLVGRSILNEERAALILERSCCGCCHLFPRVERTPHAKSATLCRCSEVTQPADESRVVPVEKITFSNCVSLYQILVD